MNNCNGNCNQGRDCTCLRDEFEHGAGALVWMMAAIAVNALVVLAVWIS